MDGKYATWAGSMLSRDKPIVVIAGEGGEEESVMRLGRIGYDDVAGYLTGGMTAITARDDFVERTERITAPALAEWLAGGRPDAAATTCTTWWVATRPGWPRSSPHDRRRTARHHRPLIVVVLGLLQAVAAVEIALMAMMAVFGVMIFDAPGSTERLGNWAFFIGVSLLPVVATVLCAVAWGLQRRHRPWWAVVTLAGVVAAGLLVFRAALGPGRLW